jgi:hypothetical protein
LDTHRGERVTCFVDDHGLDSWLDVHNQALMRVSALPSDPLSSIIIVLIVELALIGSTHAFSPAPFNNALSRRPESLLVGLGGAPTGNRWSVGI